jgi:exosortase A-associated hydrolase 2
MTEIIPQFIQGGAGQVFTLYFPSVTTPRGAVLYLPPLTEEMNRCRSLVSTQARNLARLGYAVLLLDYYGTGDSAGELKDASWSVWHEDITAASLWLAQKTKLSITLWGCRLGALLAAEAAGRAPDLYKKLLFWQPVIDGKLYLTQFLRLRVAALMDRGLPAETTDSMRAQFEIGRAHV